MSKDSSINKKHHKEIAFLQNLYTKDIGRQPTNNQIARAPQQPLRPVDSVNTIIDSLNTHTMDSVKSTMSPQDTLKYAQLDTIHKTPVVASSDTTISILDTISKKRIVDTMHKKPVDSVVNADTSIKHSTQMSYLISKDVIPDIIDHSAQDSMVWDLPNSMVYLYNKTNTKYQDITLDADRMSYNTETSIASAFGKPDSTGKIIQQVKFTQKDQTYLSDSLKYNFKSQKGLIDNTVTQQGEMFVHSQITKRIDTSAFFGAGGRFTTCSYDEPHFDFYTKKYKLEKDKVIVTGPIFPEFEGQLIPIPIPFGMFPINSHRKGGIIVPGLVTDNQRGLGLLGGGYLVNFNQYLKMNITGDIYSRLSWAVRANIDYFIRYQLKGNFRFDYQNNRTGFSGDPDFSTTKTFSLQWTHTQDNAVNPNATFSASVNFSSTRYNSTQFYNPSLGFQNQQSSSIAFGYNFKYSPVSMQLTFNHNQNNLTKMYNFTFPNLNLNVTPIYPFQRRVQVGQTKWYEKLSIGYTGNFTNNISIADSNITIAKILDTLMWGARNSLPIQLQLPPLGPIAVTPNISYAQNWYDRRVTSYWDATDSTVRSRTQKGFYAMQQLTLGLSLNTALYGTWLYGKGPIAGLRNVIRPTVSINYSPNLVKRQYYNYQSDITGNFTNTSYFGYAGSPGTFPNTTFGGINFGVSTNLEMKIRIKKDTGYEVKKITLLDNLSINSSYNFFADSMRLAPFSIAASTNLLQKINISASATLDPYQVNPQTGSDIGKYAWQGKKFSIGRITTASLTIGTNFSLSKTTKEGEKNRPSYKPNQDYTYEEWEALKYDVLKNPHAYADYSASTATIGISFSLNYTNPWDIGRQKFVPNTVWSSGINLSSSIPITPLMLLAATANISFQNMIKPQLTNLTFSMNRQIHCWNISFNLSPIGYYKSFYFKISPRASILQDLKIDKTITYY